MTLNIIRRLNKHNRRTSDCLPRLFIIILTQYNKYAISLTWIEYALPHIEWRDLPSDYANAIPSHWIEASNLMSRHLLSISLVSLCCLQCSNLSFCFTPLFLLLSVRVSNIRFDNTFYFESILTIANFIRFFVCCTVLKRNCFRFGRHPTRVTFDCNFIFHSLCLCVVCRRLEAMFTCALVWWGYKSACLSNRFQSNRTDIVWHANIRLFLSCYLLRTY